MFSEDELDECVEQEWFKQDFVRLQQYLIGERLGALGNYRLMVRMPRLLRFSEAVLASAPGWPTLEEKRASRLCEMAGDVELAHAKIAQAQQHDSDSSIHFFKAATLYDLGRLPGPSAAIATAMWKNLSTGLRDYFSRRKASLWGRLIEDSGDGESASQRNNEEREISEKSIEPALGEVIGAYGSAMQSPKQGSFEEPRKALRVLRSIAASYSTDMSGDDLSAIITALELRKRYSTIQNLQNESVLSQVDLKKLGAPVDLWPSQIGAIEAGLLDDRIRAFGIAAPTGTGKTALMRVLLADFLRRHEGARVIYIAPSRALAAQVTHDLQQALGAIGFSVVGLGGHLTVHDAMPGSTAVADVLVFTPEKADLLLRLEREAIASIGLAVIDEAHHIEDGTRGILLEFYLWRMKALLGNKCRVVQVSAVTPNIRELVEWVEPSEISDVSTTNWRAARLRIGTFERTMMGEGILQFDADNEYSVIPPGHCPEDSTQGIAALAEKLSETGVVLVLATSPGRAEALAHEISKRREESPQVGPASERLDARLERELHSDVALRGFFRKRVVYHHAQLPPRVRSAVEFAIAEHHVDIVCATTTLAEGVNFPFSTVIVESLVGTGYEISPRTLWNIAGRAGRFGVDAEGYCLLYRPSTWSRKLVEYQIDQYFPERLQDMPPVRSALAVGVSYLKQAVEVHGLDLKTLEQIDLTGLAKEKIGLPRDGLKRIRGLVNMLRVGYVHATVSGAVEREADWVRQIEHGMLASRVMDDDSRKFAARLARQQQKLVRATLERDTELLAIAARVGWSLESQAALLDWVRSCSDFQLKGFGEIVVGGRIIDPERLGYLLGPVSKLMAEFEGEKLGGFTAFVSSKWLEGLPLTVIRDAQKEKDYGRLVSVIYARVSYLLPWALFGLNELVHYVARRRQLKVGDGVKDLSVLASEGVPSFDALRLVLELDIERVDAARLAAKYRKSKRQSDVVGWLRGQEWRAVASIVREPDNRRLDPDLRQIHERLQSLAKSL